jgi:uncharacterized protein (TIGR03435 family)
VTFLAVPLLLFAGAAVAQPSAPPAFEVASIKLAASTDPYHWDASLGAIRMRGINLKQCLMAAYQVQDFQVSGGPGWVESERYDIDGKAEGPAKQDELLLMLQTLLTERFQLKLETKTKPADGFQMVVAKGGLKIKPDRSEGKAAIQVTWSRMTVARYPMGGLAQTMSHMLGVPVSDETGIEDRFAFELRWTPEQNPMSAQSGGAPAGSPSDAGAAPSLPDALLGVVGLQLRKGKVSIPVMTIAHAEKPSEN